MLRTNPDVLVIGAGPVGLTMAAELARHGVPCRIIDRLPEPSPYCRAIGVTPRTLEVWDDMGIARTMIDAGLWLTGRRIFLKDGTLLDSVNDLSGMTYGTLGIPQPETERILAAHLASFGIAIERGVALTSLQQSDNQVHVELLHANQTIEQASFRYVVGCDGSRSIVRQQLGIPFEGDRFSPGFMLGDVLLAGDMPRGLSLWAVQPPQSDGPPDFFTAIPLPERNRYRVSMLAPSLPDPTQPEVAESGATQEHGILSSRSGPSLAELQTVASRLMPSVTLSDLRWSSYFRIGMRLAARYREGNAFLAGDAAHIHPPIGGLGMNTGIQDAYNLAWKMALVLQGHASPALLESYDTERRAVGAEVIARTVESSRQFGRKPPTPSAAQQDRLADAQLLVHYRGSALSRDQVHESFKANTSDRSPLVRAGDRAPDCCGLRRERVHAPFRLFDFTRGVEHLLVVYAGSAIAPAHVMLLEGLAELFQSSRVPPCRLLAIAAPGCAIPALIGVPIAIDESGEFAAAYDPGIGTGHLIRPDGYIAYHARPLTQQGLLDYFDTLY